MRKQFTIQNPFGLQPSPARHIANMAKTFPSRVTLEIRGKSYDAKSLVQLLSAEAKFGDVVTVSADEGADAAEVVEAIGSLLTAVGPRGHPR